MPFGGFSHLPTTTMKNIHVVQQKRIKRLLEVQVLLVFTCLSACNTPLIQKETTYENWTLPPDPPENEELAMAVQFVQQNYVDTFSYSPFRDTSLQVLIGGLDPYSKYLSKESNEHFDAEINNGKEVRFGFNEWNLNDTPFITRLTPSGFAKKTGLCIGDKLLALDSVVLVGSSMSFRDSLFSASSGVNHKITILRPGEKIPRLFAIQKSLVPVKTGFCCFMLDSSTAYLWLPNFDKGVADRVESEVINLSITHRYMAHLVIDLRWNTGGLVAEVIAMLSFFNETSRPVIEVRSKIHPQNNKEYKTSRIASLRDLQLTVLTNECSYSASEIFAGTLQDWDKAIIIGQQTGGKGLVMQKYLLKDGSALYLATSRYYLPSGRCIQIPYQGEMQNSNQPESDVTIYNLLHSHEKKFRCNGTTYFTSGGRPVFDEMGIVPDILVPDYSNGFAVCNTSSYDRFLLEFELVDRYQKLLLQNSSFEKFDLNFPVEQAAKYVRKRVKEMTEESPSFEKSLALTRRLMFYIQFDYYGWGTQTPLTLKDDNLVCESKRIFSIEAQNLKQEIAVNTPKEHLGKSNSGRRTKKLAIK